MIQTLVTWFKNSIGVKIFLGILAISFGVWGVGDFVTPGMDPNVAVSVGKTDISLADLQRRFDMDLDRFRQMTGGKRLDAPEIKRSILARTVQELTYTATANAYSEDIGLVVPTDVVRDKIRNQDAFKDSNGVFNQLTYQQILAGNHISEKSFVGMVESDVRRQTILQPVMENADAPAALVDGITNYRAETRIADTLLIAAADLPAPAAPDDDALKKIYDQNIATFTAPEYRKLTVLVLRTTDLVSPDSFAPEQVKAYYDENISRYRDLEKRSVSQLVFETKEQAEAAKALAAPGDHLADIARKAKIDPPVELGTLKRDDPLAKMIGSAFDLPIGQVSDVSQTDLGWHLFEITSIVPEQTVPLASVDKQIRTAMAEDKGTDALYEASTALDDGVAGGTSLPDLAAKVGGKIVEIAAVDKDGRDPNGTEIPDLLDKQRFLETAFSTPKGSTSNLTEIPKGYYILAVDAVTPPAPRPFADVRKDVAAIWEKQARSKAAQDAAAKIAGGIGLAPLSGAAKDKGVTYAQLGPLTRFGEGLNAAHFVDSKRVSPELLSKLFAAKPGDIITADVAGGAIVARLQDVIPPASNGDAQKAREQIATSAKDGIADDLTLEMGRAFSVRFPAKVNNKSVEKLVSASAQ